MMTRLPLLAILSAFLVGGAVSVRSVHAQDVLPPDVLPPALPWSGASEALIAQADDPWITPAEAMNFRTTPSFEEVRAWLERLDRASDLISLETFGKSGEGRDLLLVRASRGADPQGRAKPVVLVQAAIHAGEVDGKDAGLMLLRDIALRGKGHLLDTVDLVFVPVLNVDGHERTSPWNFLHLRGPSNKGTESNARKINLNRDYAKLDSPEVRAMVALLRRLDPVLYIDCHVSGGFDMQYDVTYTYAGWGRYARHRATADWLERQFGPFVGAALKKAGHQPIIYPSPIDTRTPQAGIRYSPEGPRYSTGYGDFIGVPTVLVENHNLKPYRQRVLGTYVLLEAALRIAARDTDWIEQAKVDDRATRPEALLTRWSPAAEPIGRIANFKGVAFETYRSPATGREEQRWTGRPITFAMPIIGQQEEERVNLPKAWLIPAAYSEILARLAMHGVESEVLTHSAQRRVDEVQLLDMKLEMPHDGRVPMHSHARHVSVLREVPAGTVRVRADQPLGLLAAALLEPESQDSFLAWGFFPEVMTRPDGTEDFVLAPVLDDLLTRDEDVRARFDAKLASDLQFAADAQARMAWLWAHLPQRDRFSAIYPVWREVLHTEP